MPPQKPEKKVPYRRSVTDKGFRIITDRMDGLRSVSVGIWVSLGSRDAPIEKSGISHFIEHMLFKQTAKYTSVDIMEIFDEMGGQLNAFSTREYTCLYAKVLDEFFEKAFDVMSDMIQNALMKEDELESERKVILEEISMCEDTPDEIIHDYFISDLLQNHPLGQSVLGHRNAIRELTRDEIFNDYLKSYIPANIVITASGNIDHSKLEEVVNKQFRYESSGKPVKRHVLEPEIRRHRAVYNKRTEQSHILLGTLGLPAGHPDRFSLSVVNGIMGGAASNRLFRIIREEKGLAYSVYSFTHSYTDAGVWAVYAGTNPRNTETVIDIIIKELEKVVKYGFSENEVSRMKGHIKGGTVLGLEGSWARMSKLGREEIIGKRIITIDEILKKIEAVTVESVNDLAAKLFSKQDYVLTVIGPIENETEFGLFDI